MNILYLADPNSLHDLKWIKYFSQKKAFKTYILPRYHHHKLYKESDQALGVKVLKCIHDFSILRFYRTLYDAYKIKKIIKNKKIKIIHIIYAEPNALWCLFRKYFGINMIISSLGTDVLKTIPETFKNKNLINFFVSNAYRKAFRKADIITGTSISQLTSIKNFSGRVEKIKLVRTGISIKEGTNSHSNQELKDLIPFILFPRYIKPIYNHEFCLEAIKLLPNKIKKTYSMVFIGKDSGDMVYQKELEKMMKNLPDTKIQFLQKQSQPDFLKLVSNSSLVVMTPKSDGSPVTAMEAMFYKKPLIVGPIDYDKEMFDESVIRLSRWSAKELSDKMSYAINNFQKPINYSMNNTDHENNMDLIHKIYDSFIN